MKRKIYLLVGIVIIFLIAIIAIYLNNQNNNQTINLSTAPEINNENVTSGTEKYQNFILDNTLHSKDYGDIHYNVYIPDSYDGSEPYALYMTLPGYQGLYFQGVGENLKTEEFGLLHLNIIQRLSSLHRNLMIGKNFQQIKQLSLLNIFFLITILIHQEFMQMVILVVVKQCQL